MIERLYISNYLILKDSEIEFTDGLNILTGETGAGKSIIIDALSLILGERADYSIIKNGQEKLVVEGHFNFRDNKHVRDILKELLPQDEVNTEHIILRRELYKKGTSRTFINDSPVNISDLKKFGDAIIDIHSQNEHQSLLDRESHSEIIDNYISDKTIVDKCNTEFAELSGLIENFNTLYSKREDFENRREFIKYELKEINNINMVLGEDEEAETELRKLENMEDISAAINNSINSLYEGDINVSDALSEAVKNLTKIIQFDNRLEVIIKDIENSYLLIKESSDFLSKYRSELNFDNKKLEELRNRLMSINHLKKKYGMNIEELLMKAEKLQSEISFTENFDFETEELLKKINLKKENLFKTADELYKLRLKHKKDMEKRINILLKEIGLEGAEFKVEINKITGQENDLFVISREGENLRLTPRGFNEIEFLIKTNKGSEFVPLRKSASGGEISRIMLAIKTILSEKDNIGILVFDEIDSGISGRIAGKVGKLLRELSKSHQIICITHLPQIAALSEKHFYVSKKNYKSETVAEIKHLNDEEKVLEVAKLISGEQVTEASAKSALELING